MAAYSFKDIITDDLTFTSPEKPKYDSRSSWKEGLRKFQTSS